MVFRKGENPHTNKRKAVEAVTPDAKKKKGDTSVMYARLDTMLKLFIEDRDDSFLDSDATDFLVGKLKKEAVPKSLIGELAGELRDIADERNDEALRLKDFLEAVGEDTTVDQYQNTMLDTIPKMDEKGLDAFAGFLDLAKAKVDYYRHTSKKVHPEYKLQEIVMEALNQLENEVLEDAFEYRPNYRTRFRAASGAGNAAGNGESSGGSGYYASFPPPTMENITAANTR